MILFNSRRKKEKEKQEQEMLQKEKQERVRREEEQRLVKKENLICEIIDNYISISNGITNIGEELYKENNKKELILKNSLDEKELYKRFGQIVLDIYSIADNVNNYKDLAQKVFECSFIEKISKKYLNQVDYENIMINYKNSIHYFNEEYGLLINKDNRVHSFISGSVSGFINVFNELKTNYKHLDLMIVGLIIKKQNENIGWLSLEEEKELELGDEFIGIHGIEINFKINYWYNEDRMENISYFIIQILYAYIFVCYMIFLRKVKKFRENKELMCILKNIQKENNEVSKILFKFYPIYSNLYKDTFEEKLTVNEIEALILASKNKEKFDLFMEFNYYENTINDFKIDRDFKKLIDNLDKNIFMKYHSINDFNIVNNEEYFYNELFDYIITKIINNLNEDQMLDIIFNKVIYIDRLKKNDNLKEVIKEKNKYLYGVKKDEEEKINKLNINDVNSGNDFEKFLEKLFLRLGYHVALTPQTRDQGADLIIEKELVKIVVQAKFYNSTVGNKAVQEVIAAKSYYDADSCMVVTNNTFTSSAYELAKANRVKLVDGNELNSMIKIANLFLE